MEQTTAASIPASVDDLQAALRKELYVADRALAMSIYLALQLRRPLFLEGEAGVGKRRLPRRFRPRWARGSSVCSATRGWT